MLRAGLLSFALLLLSRVAGLARESAQAAAFGTSGVADVVVLMLTLPDWLAGVALSGALSYVLLPQWAALDAAGRAALQQRVLRALFVVGGGGAVLMLLLHTPLLALLAPGLASGWRHTASLAMAWSAVSLPAACVAALWVTRLQHERDFAGMYGANLVVNGVLIAALLLVGRAAPLRALSMMGLALALAMLARLVWLLWRLGRAVPPVTPGSAPALGPRPWLWAVLAAGLPLLLPFVARSLASAEGEGALATFNYAWKLVELPLMLAVQLVAVLAFPALAAAWAAQGQGQGQVTDPDAARRASDTAHALAWALACAAAAGLLVGAPALASLLFGWGRMQGGDLARLADWSRLGALGLLPQALIAVGTVVLASAGRLAWAALGPALGLTVLALLAWSGWRGGLMAMGALNLALLATAAGVLWALRRAGAPWPPASALWAPALMVGLLAASRGGWQGVPGSGGPLLQLVLAGLAALLVLAAGAAASPLLRAVLAGRWRR